MKDFIIHYSSSPQVPMREANTSQKAFRSSKYLFSRLLFSCFMGWEHHHRLNLNQYFFMCNLYNSHKIAEDTLFYLVNGKLPMSMMGCLYLKKKKRHLMIYFILKCINWRELTKWNLQFTLNNLAFTCIYT